MREKLKPCRICGGKPAIECWSSGSLVVAVRCDNPDRPDACDEAFYYSRSKNLKEAVRKWNEFQGGITMRQILFRRKSSIIRNA